MSSLATIAQLAARSVAAPRLLVLRSRDLRRRAAAAVPARAGLRRPRADGAERRRLLRARRRATTRRRSCATPTASSSSRTSAATGRRSCCRAAATPPTSSARSTAGPTTCKGELLGAPHFADNPCLNLGRSPLTNWNGLLFDGKRDVAARPRRRPRARSSTSRATCSTAIEIHECNYNWKTFIEVYLEDYHVEPFHPGLGQFVTCDDLKWQFGDWYSVQTVGVQQQARAARDRDLRALAQGGRRFLPRRDAAARRDLDGVLPEHHDRVVSARAHRQHADPARRRPHDQRRRVLLSRGDRALRARVRRGRAGRVHGDGARGRRDRRAHGRRAPRAVPRRGAAKRARTSRRWRTGCSTSTNSSGASSTPHRPRAECDETVDSDVHDAHQHVAISAADRARAIRRSSSSTCATISRSRTPGARREYRRGTCPGARFAHVDRDLSAPKTGRTAGIRCPIARSLRRASSAAWASTRRSRSSPTIRARACTRRACGGCCAGSGTTPWRCSTAALPRGRAKDGR